MRLIVTADLHYGLRDEGDSSTHRLAEEVQASGAEVLVLAGDNAAMNPSHFRECFQAFRNFPGRKLAICGNHDLWTQDGDSLSIFEERFPEWASESGFGCLEGNPVVIGKVGIVGTMGWYDYSFRDESLGLEDRYYEQKFHPRLARWNDGQYVKMDLSDREFSELLNTRLESDIRNIYDQVEEIVVVTHLVAFECMLIRRPEQAWRFCNAFIGCRALGELLLKYPKARHHYCGHTHQPARHQIEHLTTVNVGSTYYDKRAELLEL